MTGRRDEDQRCQAAGAEDDARRDQPPRGDSLPEAGSDDGGAEYATDRQREQGKAGAEG
jgi:hypothetical protein